MDTSSFLGIGPLSLHLTNGTRRNHYIQAVLVPMCGGGQEVFSDLEFVGNEFVSITTDQKRDVNERSIPDPAGSILLDA